MQLLARKYLSEYMISNKTRERTKIYITRNAKIHICYTKIKAFLRQFPLKMDRHIFAIVCRLFNE